MFIVCLLQHWTASKGMLWLISIEITCPLTWKSTGPSTVKRDGIVKPPDVGLLQESHITVMVLNNMEESFRCLDWMI